MSACSTHYYNNMHIKDLHVQQFFLTNLLSIGELYDTNLIAVPIVKHSFKFKFVHYCISTINIV